MERKHGEHGWFERGPHSYESLLEIPSVKMLYDSYGGNKSQGSALYQFLHFLKINEIDPEEALELSDAEIKMAIKQAVLSKSSEEKYSAARLMFYVTTRFFELNGRPVFFSRTERRAILKKKRPKKIAIQYIPTREDVYRMVDAYPRKSERQQLRGKAILLSLWQSGVRSGCLCSWTWGIFADKLYRAPKIPVSIKVVAYRPEGVYNVAEDTKLSSYAVNYYYTFLHEEAANALKQYLDVRIEDDWQPKPSDPVFVTEGTVSQGEPIDPQNVIELVKSAVQQIGIDPESVWTHCLRKSFRKTLYRGGVDPDVAEALMGHKLPGSRGSYFEYHDVSFVEEEYMRGYWSRVSIGRLRRLEEQVATARKDGQEKGQRVEEVEEQLREKTHQIQDLQKQIDDIRMAAEENNLVSYYRSCVAALRDMTHIFEDVNGRRKKALVTLQGLVDEWTKVVIRESFVRATELKEGSEHMKDRLRKMNEIIGRYMHIIEELKGEMTPAESARFSLGIR